MLSDKVALLFPGQGAHCPAMLDGFARNTEFGKLYGVVCDVLGYAPLESIARDPSLINTNLFSNMLTVLASCLAFKRFQQVDKRTPDYLAGHSVGQLTALHIAGCFDFPSLAKLVKVRASLMEECLKAVPGSMVAIIGLPLKTVEEICCQLQSQGHSIWISSFNCVGQYSLSGTKEAISEAMILAATHQPKRLLELPVAGAWHSPLVGGCQAPISAYLKQCRWLSPQIPVIDNVTSDFLPGDTEGIKEQLAKHLTHPVRWDAGIKLLVSHGCTRFIEIGYGNVLTKFGFFIDRTATFESFTGETRAVCAE